MDLALSQGNVPYSVLFDHIRRGGVLRRDAMIELRKRVPEESLDWLDYIQKLGRWTDLARCYVPREHEEQTDVRVLSSTLAWIEEVRGNSKGKTAPAPCSDVEGLYSRRRSKKIKALSWLQCISQMTSGIPSATDQVAINTTLSECRPLATVKKLLNSSL